MATTTNYSWTTPDDTALVKDGAAAIRSLGTAIDTTVFTNAGAAIAKSIVDAKGDLIVGTADNTVARLPVGANTYTLVADSSEATGLKWAAPGGGGLTYSTWTPSYFNITVGNGTVVSKYAQSGKFVHAFYQITLGSTSSIGGDARMTLPVDLATARTAVGALWMEDNTVAAYLGLVAARNTSSVSDLVMYGFTTGGKGQAAEFGATAPFTWSANDKFWYSIVYEGV